MAKTKAPPNLGTKRASDNDLSPHELPTEIKPGSKPNYQITTATPGVHSFYEQQMHGLGMDSVDRTGGPDVHEIETDLAGIAGHTWGKNTHARKATREQFGGGVGETKVTRWKRGGLQDTGDRPADRKKIIPGETARG
jgi:hypothetical protein